MLKHVMTALLAVSSTLVPLVTVPAAYAQAEVAAPFDPAAVVVTQDDVLAACASAQATEAGCKAKIAEYFAYLKATNVVGADLEAAIAGLVVALAEANVESPEIKAVVVAAIEDIGTNYATGEQATQILELAQTIEEGGDVETAAIIGSQA